MTDTAARPQTRVAIVTLGCGRNEVDSDQLAGLFVRDGAVVVDDAEDADVVLVNTCTFIAPAKQESIDTVLAACDLKDDGTQAVLVVGCMAERYPDELAEAIPEADAIVGFEGYSRLPQLVGDVLDGRPYERVVRSSGPASRDEPATVTGNATVRKPLPLLVMPTAPDEAPPEAAPPARVTTSQDDLDRMPASGPRFPVRRFGGGDGPTPPWAYLKIASGCDRVCTFCAIPSFRGRFRSRPVDEIVAEAEWLASQGARELVLVSENTTSYGKDLAGGRSNQVELLTALSQIEDVSRIRLMYLQPAELQRPLIEAMTSLPKVASYFDLSLQHVSADVLKRMARSGSPERFLTMIETIRALDPDAVFRSNFILGFPGETEEDVDQLEDFLEQARLDWVGFFPYSQEDGTPSAEFDGQVPEDVTADRLDRVSRLQEHLADDAALRQVGRRLDVLVEEHVYDDGTLLWCAGRSFREAPDTDGEVRLVDADGKPLTVAPGTSVAAEVVAAEGVDLVAVAEDGAAGA